MPPTKTKKKKPSSRTSRCMCHPADIGRAVRQTARRGNCKVAHKYAARNAMAAAHFLNAVRTLSAPVLVETAATWFAEQGTDGDPTFDEQYLLTVIEESKKNLEYAELIIAKSQSAKSA